MMPSSTLGILSLAALLLLAILAIGLKKMVAAAGQQTTWLHDAASRGGETCVRFILATGWFEVDAKDPDGLTPFALAAIYGHVGVLGSLLKAGADPLQVFNVEQTFSLARRPMDTDYHDGRRWVSVKRTTAAVLACLLGNRAMLELLLRFGVPVDHSYNEWTLLVAAAATRSNDAEAMKMVSLLLQHGAKPDGTFALQLACLRGDPGVARLLLDSGESAYVNATSSFGYGGTPLHAACQRSVCLGLVELLLERKANVEAKDWTSATPLVLATRSDGRHAPAVAELLVRRGGADINAKSHWTALDQAAVYGHATMAKKLLELGASPDVPLGYACFFQQPDVAELLLDAGADVNFRDRNMGWTPLFATVKSHRSSNNNNNDDEKKMRILELLVGRGADVNWRDRWGSTSLQVACRDGPPPNLLQVISFLLESGADANAADENGLTPLHVLQQRFHPRPDEEDEHVRQAVRLLLAHGVDSEATSNLGLTPLLQAVTCSHVVEQFWHNGQEAEERDAEMMQELFEEKKDFLPDYEDD